MFANRLRYLKYKSDGGYAADMPRFRTSTGTSAGEIYALIRARRDITRTEIGQLNGLSRTAGWARVPAVAAEGLVIARELAPPPGGRPASFVSFNAAGGVVLSAAIG